MKSLKILLFIPILATFVTSIEAQLKIDSLGFETFESVEGDSTYIMKKYFLVLLKKAPEMPMDSAQSAKIQAAHLNHLNEMAEAGKLSIAGPVGDDGEIRGILILNVPKEEEAIKLVSEDPAVKAGRLIYEVMSWWAAKGSVLD